MRSITRATRFNFNGYGVSVEDRIIQEKEGLAKKVKSMNGDLIIIV